jgi:hypothetical protein
LDGQTTQGFVRESVCVRGRVGVGYQHLLPPYTEREATGLGLTVGVAVSSGASAVDCEGHPPPAGGGVIPSVEGTHCVCPFVVGNAACEKHLTTRVDHACRRAPAAA